MLWGFTEISNFLGGGGGVDEKPIYWGNCLKKGGELGQFADLRGVLVEKEEGVFEEGG